MRLSRLPAGKQHNHFGIVLRVLDAKYPAAVLFFQESIRPADDHLGVEQRIVDAAEFPALGVGDFDLTGFEMEKVAWHSRLHSNVSAHQTRFEC
jgi:hypothetical protein